MGIQQEFPFMKLPLELRLMVYDRLPVEIKQHHFTKNNSIRSHSMGSYSFTIVSKSVNLSILAASRQIYAEATPIIQRKLQDILQTPPRLIIDIISSTKLYKNGGPLWHISRFLAGRAKTAGKSLGTVPYLGTGAGATHERYDPHADPDHSRLSHLMDRWFRSLEYQQQTQSLGFDDGYPPIEIGLTAPRNWPHQTVLYALRQLAYVLFAEHGGLRFSLRNAHDLYPTCTDDMRSQERGVIEKVMPGRIGRSSRAIQGCSIDSREFGEDWSNRMYHRGCVH